MRIKGSLPLPESKYSYKTPTARGQLSLRSDIMRKEEHDRRIYVTNGLKLPAVSITGSKRPKIKMLQVLLNLLPADGVGAQ